MTDTFTPLDLAHAAMEANPGDDAAMLRFYSCLADSELILLLAREPADDTLDPAIFPIEGGPVVLAFDTEDRLADFSEAPAPYAALPGRVIAGLLADAGMGLGLNFGVAPSSMLLPPDVLAWLVDVLAQAPDLLVQSPDVLVQAPDAGRGTATGFAPPDLPDATLTALRDKIARLPGQAREALLVAAIGSDGTARHLLAFVDAVAGAEPALAKAIAEALAFSGAEGAEIDVTFVAGSDLRHARLAAVARVLPVPQPVQPQVQVLTPAAPGSDPAKPPRLR